MLNWDGTLLLQNTYDGLGRCVKRDGYYWGSAVMLTAYDGWKPIVEWDGSGNLHAWNVYGPGADEILWRYQADVGHLRYHHDKQGSVTAVLDWWGNVVEKYRYTAFGLPTVTDPWDTDWQYTRTWSNYGNRFMFTGREWYPHLWLYDYRHRWYDPGHAPFLQPDPTGFDGGDMNLFRYCADDPVDLSDAMGTNPLPYHMTYLGGSDTRAWAGEDEDKRIIMAPVAGGQNDAARKFGRSQVRAKRGQSYTSSYCLDQLSRS